MLGSLYPGEVGVVVRTALVCALVTGLAACSTPLGVKEEPPRSSSAGETAERQLPSPEASRPAPVPCAEAAGVSP